MRIEGRVIFEAIAALEHLVGNILLHGPAVEIGSGPSGAQKRLVQLQHWHVLVIFRALRSGAFFFRKRIMKIFLLAVCFSFGNS